MKKTIVFDNNFSIEFDSHIFSYARDNTIDIVLNEENVSLNYNLEPTNKKIIFGWNNQPFPTCCGIDIVSNLHFNHDLYTLEQRIKWYEWVMARRRKPAIGYIPHLIHDDNSLDPTSLGGYYEFFRERGIPYGPPLKNTVYENHAIQAYLFMPDRHKDSILNPKKELL